MRTWNPLSILHFLRPYQGFPPRPFDSGDPLLRQNLIADTTQLPRVTLHTGELASLGEIQNQRWETEMVLVEVREKNEKI